MGHSAPSTGTAPAPASATARREGKMSRCLDRPSLCPGTELLIAAPGQRGSPPPTPLQGSKRELRSGITCPTCRLSLRKPETQPRLPSEGTPTGRACLPVPQRHCSGWMNPQILNENTKGTILNVSMTQRPPTPRTHSLAAHGCCEDLDACHSLCSLRDWVAQPNPQALHREGGPSAASLPLP